jgi:hypothetical protein
MILCNEKLCGLYRSAGVVRVLTCKRLRWAGYVDRMEEKNNENMIKVFLNLLGKGKLKERKEKVENEEGIKTK